MGCDLRISRRPVPSMANILLRAQEGVSSWDFSGADMKLFLNHRLNRNRLAFTLIDTVIGMGVLGIAIVSLFACFTFGFNVVKISREDLQATHILQEKMETIRLYNWAQINSPNDIPATFKAPFGTNAPNFFQGIVVIANANFDDKPVYDSEIRKVSVTVSWTNNFLRRARTASTFVSKHGLLNYTLK